MTNAEHKIIESTKKFVEKWMTKDASGHDFYHVLRVYDTAVFLSEGENVDQFVVQMAALLHDVDDPKLRKPHVKIKKVTEYLTLIKLDESLINQITDIIDNMSYSAHLRGQKVTTLEGKIVQDADRLDAIGAIGIARAFAYGGSRKRPMYQGDTGDESSIAHFYQKLLKLPKLMNTPKAKILSRSRLKTMKQYLAAFHSEWQGPTPILKENDDVQ